MSAPTQFRKKPVVISAIQWTGENLVDVIHFTDGRPPNNKSSHAGMMWDQYVDVVRKDGLKIFTMEGKMDASIGDWIIKGVKGEHYPCKPEIFALTYDDASASTDLSQAAVAAALSAAASELDGELSEESTALLGAWAVEWAKQATSVQDHIRALITQPQHDALAAHVAAEVAKARAEDAEMLAESRAYALALQEELRVRTAKLERECRLTQAQVDRMLVNSTKMDANITTLTEAAAHVLHDIDDIVANSEGVAGLHMNGEVAEWHSLMSGGSFEAWLRSVEVLRAALTPTADKEPKT